jgi:hypothetical protein
MKTGVLSLSVYIVFTMLFTWLFSSKIQAQTGSVLGIHILHPGELTEARQLVAMDNTDSWHYVTIPLSLTELDKSEEWQIFFDQCREQKMIPIVRLTTSFENGNWKIPTREDTTRLLDFLNQLNWPTPDRHIIVFNEVNHAKEWGGEIQPASYSAVLRFVSTWATAQADSYVVLPAAMDLAAPNGRSTMEAFTYLNQMAAADPDIFSMITYWNSHSYPNPGFSSSPERITQDSLRGFEHELRFLKQKTNQDFQVFITETGWSNNRTTNRWLETYYTYALQHVWSDPRVVAVTPFILKGDPGPFKSFTFLDQFNQPTPQYTAVQKALTKLGDNS